MRSGTKHLRIASAIQIVLGITTILATYLLIGEADETMITMAPEKALGILVMTYASGFFQIFSGIAGLCLANKKSIITVILGAVLFIPQHAMYTYAGYSISTIILNGLMMLLPYYYWHNAYMNYKEA